MCVKDQKNIFRCYMYVHIINIRIRTLLSKKYINVSTIKYLNERNVCE